jgi:hypothetical protein
MEQETHQQGHVEVRALQTFGIGETLIQPGDIVLVSKTRADYLRFLGVAEFV